MPTKKSTGKSINNKSVIDFYDVIGAVLKANGVPTYYYSIGEQVDDSVCIEYIDNKWAVYESFRGKRIHLRFFCSVFNAGCELFESVVVGAEKVLAMKNELWKRLEQFSSSNKSLTDFKNVEKQQLIIKGGNPLKGEVEITGSKNAALPIIAAAIMTDETVTLKNIPDIIDVDILLKSIIEIGAQVKRVDKHTVIINGSTIYGCSVEYEGIKKIRASYYLIGALLGKYHYATVPLPGGNIVGSRPIDQHLKAFRAIGANIRIEHGTIEATCDHITGTDILLDVLSVGTTINTMIAATLADGCTTIDYAAREPEVVDVANFLRNMGAEIYGAGTDIIRIRGVKKLHGCTYSIIPDMIEAGTFMMATAATKGDVFIKNIIPNYLRVVSAKLMEIGCEVEQFEDSIHIIVKKRLRRTHVQSHPYPGFPTNLLPQMCTVLALSEGISVVTETIFTHRVSYIEELKQMGAHINVDEGRIAIVDGIERFRGGQVSSSDTRGGAALVIAALQADGYTIINNTYSIFSGYEDFDEKLRGLGAQIEKVESVEEIENYKRINSSVG